MYVISGWSSSLNLRRKHWELLQGKCMRDGVKRVRAFPSSWIPSGVKLCKTTATFQLWEQPWFHNYYTEVRRVGDNYWNNFFVVDRLASLTVFSLCFISYVSFDNRLKVRYSTAHLAFPGTLSKCFRHRQRWRTFWETEWSKPAFPRAP